MPSGCLSNSLSAARKIDALAPIPSANDTMTAAAKLGERRRLRTPAVKPEYTASSVERTHRVARRAYPMRSNRDNASSRASSSVQPRSTRSSTVPSK